MRKIYLLLALFITSCQNKRVTCSDKVKLLIQTIIDADNKSDIKTVLSCYADTAVLMPPGKTQIRGMKAIDSNYQAIFSNSALNLSTKVEDVIVNGTNAVAYGVNTGSVLVKGDSISKEVNSKYMMILKRNEKNEWKITRLIWNDN